MKLLANWYLNTWNERFSVRVYSLRRKNKLPYQQNKQTQICTLGKGT